MIVDTGADCTVIPGAIARSLGLPRVDSIDVMGVTGEARKSWVYAAWLETANGRALARVAAVGEEGILGRDSLQNSVVTLDGPRSVMTVSPSRGSPRSRSGRSKRV
jgi:predicted aspartyl protease